MHEVTSKSKYKGVEKLINTPNYNAWPQIDIFSIEKPETDISFILERVHK